MYPRYAIWDFNDKVKNKGIKTIKRHADSAKEAKEQRKSSICNMMEKKTTNEFDLIRRKACPAQYLTLSDFG